MNADKRRRPGPVPSSSFCLLLLFLIPIVVLGSSTLPAPANRAKHWAFEPLQPGPVPLVKDTLAARGPVDRFILAKLEEKNLQLAGPATRVALVRRLTLDLIGLPPTADEIEEFVTDDRPDAGARLVERLLAPAHFGECWGRHWLDWSGYVDVLGGDNDAGTIKLGQGKWRYRDYVVRALAEDKPFDEFLREQIAGDEMIDWRGAAEWTPAMVDLLTATTFLRSTADDTDESELNTTDIRYGVLQRTAEAVVNNLLALTWQCAKCHDHKYDPIPQRDYYRFLAYFTPAFNPDAWLQPTNRALPDVGAAAREVMLRHNRSVDESVHALQERRAALEEPARLRLLNDNLAKLPEEIREDTRRALRTPASKRDSVQSYLAAKFEKSVAPGPAQVQAALSEPQRAALAAMADESKRLEATRQQWGVLQAVYDVGPPPATRLLKRGDYLAPGEEVQPGIPSALMPSSAASASGATAPEPCGATSGRRLALARWLTDPQSLGGQLVARVLVNRVWQQLFGVGLVETSDNFGLAGARPSHPELLDYLAADFIRNGWRLKPLLRQLLASAVYQQSSSPPASSSVARARELDPDDTLLWRQRLRRLEAEAVRDSLLAVSGQLDRTVGGPPVPIESRPDGLVVLKNNNKTGPPEGRGRRSLYLLARRNYQFSLLSTFDQPAMPVSCARRISSAVVAQSLTMLNDDFVRDSTRSLAARVAGLSPGLSSEPEPAIRRAFQFALGRLPDPEESAWCVEHFRRQQERCEQAGDAPADARQQALRNLCHTLLNSSEFLYLP